MLRCDTATNPFSHSTFVWRRRRLNTAVKCNNAVELIFVKIELAVDSDTILDALSN